LALFNDRSLGHRSPLALAIRDVYQFAQKDLVLTRDNDVFLGLLKLGSLFLLYLVLFHFSLNVSGLFRFNDGGCFGSYGLADLGNLGQLRLMDPLVAKRDNEKY